ncbi:hypothetical protein J3A65_000919 [Rhizobium sp. PvP014]|nr:hypothetical protein [Rhizobium sp. PvP014]MBP2531528.1 hypothetical protein [Rhizobium sp. PvP099]
MISDAAVMIYPATGVRHRVFADPRAGLDHGACQNLRSTTDYDSTAQDCVRINDRYQSLTVFCCIRLKNVLAGAQPRIATFGRCTDPYDYIRICEPFEKQGLVLVNLKRVLCEGSLANRAKNR